MIHNAVEITSKYQIEIMVWEQSQSGSFMMNFWTLPIHKSLLQVSIYVHCNLSNCRNPIVALFPMSSPGWLRHFRRSDNCWIPSAVLTEYIILCIYHAQPSWNVSLRPSITCHRRQALYGVVISHGEILSMPCMGKTQIRSILGK